VEFRRAKYIWIIWCETDINNLVAAAFNPLSTMRTALFTLLAAASVLQVSAQDIESTGDPIEFDQIHNRTSIVGSWSSGSKAVQTGPVSLRLLQAIRKMVSDFANIFRCFFRASVTPSSPPSHIQLSPAWAMPCTPNFPPKKSEINLTRLVAPKKGTLRRRYIDSPEMVLPPLGALLRYVFALIADPDLFASF
jgi:hypothetical protein